MHPRTTAQADASRRNGARGHGPVSAAGAARSSLNASVHGLRSGRLAALPHEDPQEVEHHRQMWRAELGAESPAEIEVADSIALLRWKLRRIDEVEQRRLASEIGIRLGETPEMKFMTMIENTLTALSTMVSVMKTAIPYDRHELDALLAPVDATLEMIGKVEEASPAVVAGHKDLVDAVGRLRETSWAETDVAAYATVVEAARTAAVGVEALVSQARQAVEAARERVAMDLPLPGDQDVARRVRYRRDAERALKAELEFLVSLRARRVQMAASGSFGLPVPA
ncbi:MAG: hypothetical protein WCK73_13810 [Deltaproteobacteria bacterium]